MPIDKLFDELNRVASIGFKDCLLGSANWTNYPPHSVYEYVDGNVKKFLVELAVAGFKRDELTVEKSGEYIFIKGAQKSIEGKGTIIYRGLSKRDFNLKILVAKFVEVSAVKLEDGLLKIELEYVIPDEEKTRIFEIL
jgi:molecular chaperone IbpA